MIHRNAILGFMILAMVSCSEQCEMSQWRGPDRDGKYPETGLMEKWPEGGPEMFWSVEGLGAGHGSVAIADGRIFILGMPDTMGVIYSFDMQGKLLWKKEYGVEWYRNFTGPRSTPTIIGELLYFVSGQGEVFCMDVGSGDVVWSVDMFDQFGAQETKWGIAESPLIDGDNIIITPGGKEDNVVALDRFSGKTVWTSRGNGEQSSYCSPILAEHNGTRLVLTMTAESILGIDADNGQTYWRVEHRQRNLISANSPLYHEGNVYCVRARADTLSGHIMLRLSEDGKSAEVGWRNEEWFNLMGGFILHEGDIYGSSYRKKNLYCLDAASGELNYVSDSLDGGAVIFAEGLFYCYGENGVVSLVEANNKGLNVISSFEVKLGTRQHWSHPVIHNGRLYVHHGDALMCYDITAMH